MWNIKSICTFSRICKIVLVKNIFQYWYFSKAIFINPFAPFFVKQVCVDQPKNVCSRQEVLNLDICFGWEFFISMEGIKVVPEGNSLFWGYKSKKHFRENIPKLQGEFPPLFPPKPISETKSNKFRKQLAD